MTGIALIGNVANNQETKLRVDPAVAKAAQQFEAVLLRSMLSSLEKTTKLGGADSSNGSSLYSSMMVDALADSLAESGGIGLADAIVKEISPKEQGVALGGPPVTKFVTQSAQVPANPAVHQSVVDLHRANLSDTHEITSLGKGESAVLPLESASARLGGQHESP